MSKLENAKTQYTDLQGTVALDFHGAQDDLGSFARSKNIDTDKFYPVGLEFYIGIGEEVYLDFLCVDVEMKDAYEAAHGGVQPLARITREDTIMNFFGHVKRFKVCTLDKHDRMENYEIVKEINTENEVDEIEA